jgi:RNA polymerase sigma-70 factor, ECF subfamily
MRPTTLPDTRRWARSPRRMRWLQEDFWATFRPPSRRAAEPPSRRVVNVDEQVVSRARRSDPEAIAILYREFHGTLFRAALRITRSRHDAEDLLQDLFLTLPRKLESFENRGSLEGWLRKITVRAALALVATRLPAAPSQRRMNPGTNEEQRAIDRVALAQGLRKLPAMYRAVLVLKDVEGYSHHEIASILGVTVANSKVLLHRARGRMRMVLFGRH